MTFGLCPKEMPIIQGVGGRSRRVSHERFGILVGWVFNPPFSRMGGEVWWGGTPPYDPCQSCAKAMPGYGNAGFGSIIFVTTPITVLMWNIVGSIRSSTGLSMPPPIGRFRHIIGTGRSLICRPGYHPGIAGRMDVEGSCRGKPRRTIRSRRRRFFGM